MRTDTDHHHDLIGCVVKPDEWRLAEKLISSDWDEAKYRITTGNDIIPSLAVNIEITGRTHRLAGPAMRCKITFVGDGEPDQVTHGWLRWPV